ncbi:hypothetical protein GCM10008915_22370 [Bifidobacterium pullorum subsp. gallinarum]
MNYGYQALDFAAMSLPADSWHHLKVVVSGTHIKIYVNHGVSPVIDYTDTSMNPFTHGKVGLRVMNSNARFDNVKVNP